MSYYIRKKAVKAILDRAEKGRLDKRVIVSIGVKEGLSGRSSLKLLQDMVWGGLLREEDGHWYRTEKVAEE